MKPTRRTVALGLAAVVLVVAAVAATFINHKPSAESKERKAVSDYIDTVNLLQNQMHIQLTKVSLAYRDLSAGSIRRKEAPAQLGAAAATLHRLDRRLIATPAPPQASKLRALVIKLVAQESAMTLEVRALALFTPRFSVFLKQLRAISARFDTAMRAVPTAKNAAQRDAAAAAQAVAIDEYVAGVNGLLKVLDGLHAPAVVAPTFDAEVRSLQDVTVTGTRLSAELRSAKRAHLEARIRAFTLAGREAGSLAAQRAQIAAIRAYNRRSRAVGATNSAVQDELSRLGRVLP